MNCLVSEPPLDEEAHKDSWENVEQTISYWVTRLSPLIGSDSIFAGCNRIGTEKGHTFTGSSCVLKLGEEPFVIDYAHKDETKVLVVEMDIKH